VPSGLCGASVVTALAVATKEEFKMTKSKSARKTRAAMAKKPGKAAGKEAIPLASYQVQTG
jgi:hypothetical protein